MFFSDEISKNFENFATLNFLHNMERVQRINNGIKTPILKTAIPNLDKLSIKELQLAVNEKIKYYYENLAKKFLN